MSGCHSLSHSWVGIWRRVRHLRHLRFDHSWMIIFYSLVLDPFLDLCFRYHGSLSGSSWSWLLSRYSLAISRYCLSKELRRSRLFLFWLFGLIDECRAKRCLGARLELPRQFMGNQDRGLQHLWQLCSAIGLLWNLCILFISCIVEYRNVGVSPEYHNLLKNLPIFIRRLFFSRR